MKKYSKQYIASLAFNILLVTTCILLANTGNTTPISIDEEYTQMDTIGAYYRGHILGYRHALQESLQDQYYIAYQLGMEEGVDLGIDEASVDYYMFLDHFQESLEIYVDNINDTDSLMVSGGFEIGPAEMYDRVYFELRLLGVGDNTQTFKFYNVD